MEAANKRDRGDGGIPVLLHAERAWPAAPQHDRSPERVGHLAQAENRCQCY
jgi:hypothetical protein